MLMIGECMKKYKLLFVFIFVFMIFSDVKGITLEECTTEKMNNLKEIAKKIEFNYTYEMKTSGDVKYPDFTINAINLNKDLKALVIEDFESMNYREFKYDGKGNGSLSGFIEGQTVTITMKAYTIDKCSTKTVAVKQVKLPYYNYFFMSSTILSISLQSTTGLRCLSRSTDFLSIFICLSRLLAL